MRLPVPLRNYLRPVSAAALACAAALAGAGCDLSSNFDPSELSGTRSNAHQRLPERPGPAAGAGSLGPFVVAIGSHVPRAGRAGQPTLQGIVTQRP